MSMRRILVLWKSLREKELAELKKRGRGKLSRKTQKRCEAAAEKNHLNQKGHKNVHRVGC